MSPNTVSMPALGAPPLQDGMARLHGSETIEFDEEKEVRDSLALFEEAHGHHYDASAHKHATASRREMTNFVESHNELWMMLAVRVKVHWKEAVLSVTRAAMELATGLEGKEALHAKLTPQQFHQFREKYILDEEGSREFFHRAIFAVFDRAMTGFLNEKEIEDLLDFICGAKLAFPRCPPKEKLQENISKILDTKPKGERLLTFQEVRGAVYIVNQDSWAKEAASDKKFEADCKGQGQHNTKREVSSVLATEEEDSQPCDVCAWLERLLEKNPFSKQKKDSKADVAFV